MDVFDEMGIEYYLTENNDFLNQNEVRSMLALFWLLMPYKKDKLVYRGDEFLNFRCFKYEFFELSKQTQNILEDIQKKFEEDVVRAARDVFREQTGLGKALRRIWKGKYCFKIINFLSVDTSFM